MSIMMAETDELADAAGELWSINAMLRAGNSAAAGPTTAVMPAGSDLVSLLTASQFVKHAEVYQTISTQAAAIQEQLAATLGLSAGSYAVTEAANRALIG
ncbi:PE family protein [Mycobacterium sp.]|uniref:PE family protein n=1 Tax=Mycobacterium sp. TaxID=1785 RepID=UPI003A84D8F8